MYHIFSVNPSYPLNRVVESVRERDEAISGFHKLYPTIPVYYQKVKEGSSRKGSAHKYAPLP